MHVTINITYLLKEFLDILVVPITRNSLCSVYNVPVSDAYSCAGQDNF